MKKQNQPDLLELVPHGLIVSRTWLRDQGVRRHAADNWLKSGQLVAVARGVFKRPDTELTWQGVVCSLQRMSNWDWLRVGGVTALAEWGMAHYISSIEQKKIHLYGSYKLPTWINDLLPNITFVRHSAVIDFDAMAENDGLHFRLWKSQNFSYGFDKLRLDYSVPELAILEALLDVPKGLSFEHANLLQQGLTTLSPNLLSNLLGYCTSVKVKRLMLYLAENNKSVWFKKIDQNKFSMESGALGSGKRVIVKGGKLDPKYLITVPQDMGGDFG